MNIKCCTYIDNLSYLKNSGLIVRMSSDMYITSDGTCNEEFKTIPDYEIKDCTRTSNFAVGLNYPVSIELII